MKESYRKGVASHPGPESCVASLKAAIEALTGESAAKVLSCEIIATSSQSESHDETACPSPLPEETGAR